MSIQPVVSNIADLFTWKTIATIASNSPVNNANHTTAQIKTLADSFFLFIAFRGSTNYDSVTQINTEDPFAPVLIPAVVPNNFSVLVRRNNRFLMMDQPCPQGVICSTGYRAGVQVPWPVLYPPNTVFNIDLYNTAPVILTQSDQTTAIPMRIDFGMAGYNVPSANLRTFLDSWPELCGIDFSSLTGIRVPMITAP